MSNNLKAKATLFLALVGSIGFASAEGLTANAMCDKPQKTVLIGNVSCSAPLCKLSSGSTSTGLGALIQMAQSSGSMANVGGLTNDLGSILSSSLRQTKCFTVLEQEGMEQAKNQMALIGKKFTPPPVDLIVNATVSEVDIEDNQQNLLFVKVGSKSAKLTMDTKIVDPNTGSVLDSKSFSSSSSDAATRFELGGLVRVGQGNSQLGLTELLRDASIRAAQDIALQFK